MPDPTTTAAPQQQTTPPAPQQPQTAQQPSQRPTGPVPTTINVARAPDGKFATAAQQAAEDARTAAAVVGGGQTAPAPDLEEQPGEQAAAPLPTFKIKVNGEEREIDYETARRELEIGFGAKRKFGELGQRQQQLEQLAQQLTTDPAVAMQALGVDPEQWAVQYLNQVTAMASMSPQEQAVYQQQLQLQQYEAQIAEREAAIQRQQYEQQNAADLQVINQHLPALLQKHSLPKDPEIIEEVASYLEEAREAGVGITPDTVARAVALTEQREVQRATRFLQSCTGEQLMRLLGEKGRTEFRKYELESHRARQKQNAQMPRQTFPDPQRQQQPKKMLTESEYLALQRQRFGG